MKFPYDGDFKVSQEFSLGRHNGLDIVGLSNKELVSICDGTVYQSRIVTDKNNLTWQWGNYVTIKANTGELITYAHLSKRLVKQGQRVKTGDVIGIEGNTGYSFGSHCHLEIRNNSNAVTSAVNTPLYTGIPNMVQKIRKENAMTSAERLEFDKLKKKVTELENKLATSKEKVYHYWTEIPMWALRPLYALYKGGYFAGAAANDLNITQTKLECAVMNAKLLKTLGKINYAETTKTDTLKSIQKELGIG